MFLIVVLTFRSLEEVARNEIGFVRMHDDEWTICRYVVVMADLPSEFLKAIEQMKV